MALPIKINEIKDTSFVVTVEISKLLMFRIWIAIKLVQLATIVAGFDFQIENDEFGVTAQAGQSEE